MNIFKGHFEPEELSKPQFTTLSRTMNQSPRNRKGMIVCENLDCGRSYHPKVEACPNCGTITTYGKRMNARREVMRPCKTCKTNLKVKDYCYSSMGSNAFYSGQVIGNFINIVKHSYRVESLGFRPCPNCGDPNALDPCPNTNKILIGYFVGLILTGTFKWGFGFLQFTFFIWLIVSWNRRRILKNQVKAARSQI
jgi:hypothetical protein